MWSNYKYRVGIESQTIRGTDEPRSWDITNLIISACAPNKSLLDIGCGTAFKLIPICVYLNLVVGLEPNYELLKKAQINMQQQQIENVLLVNGRAENLPFPNSYFDIVTAMLAPHNAEEIHRVLKPEGVAIVERVGDHDKHKLKKLFGKDEKGWRGYLYTDDENSTPMKDIYTAEFSRFFRNVTVQNGFWKTYYTPKNLIKLLKHAPTVRDFNKDTDQEFIETAIKEFNTEKGIEIIQNRLLICASK